MPIISTTKKISQAVLNFMLPAQCLSCHAVVDTHGAICATCWNDINFIGLHKCYVCGLPFAFDLGPKALCRHCTEEKPKFNKAVAVCKYENTARKLAIRLKFGDSVSLAPYLAKMMVGSGSELIGKADIIAPIPLHFMRKIARKYNQAALLARQVAKISEKNYEPFLLKRVRRTKQQTKLHRRDRKSNVDGAFVVANVDVFGKTVLLVDDVMTTGSTLSACAKALKERGARRVYCLVFARVLLEKV